MKRIPVSVIKGTIKVIDDVVNKYYADCYNTEGEMHRLLLWQSKLKKFIEVKDGS